MSKTAEIIDGQIKKRIAQIDFLDTATVVGVDANRYWVDIIVHGTNNKLTIKNVPVMTLAGGASHGIVALPKVDDTVIIAYLEPNKSSPYVLGSYYTNDDPTDENFEIFDTTEDIYMVQHHTGAYIKIDTDGNIILHPATGKKIKMQS